MAELTKEWLQKAISQNESMRDEIPFGWDEDDINMLEALRIALASLEAEPAIHRWRRVTVEPYGPYPWHYGNFIGFSKPVEGIEDEYYYPAPPAPVSVPAAMEMDDDFDSAFEHGKAIGWNAYRAAMLQGSDGTLTNEGTITATQFKPVADLYGLTSPTGGETSFTFDAVEARDFIDGGWSCQEYVELERFQEAVSGNSPVIPDGWVACSERMPEDEQEVLTRNKMGHCFVSFFDEHSGLFFDRIDVAAACCIEHILVTHWMPLPAAPQQEVR
ncbi:DUF551 domain-containing protein [Enterobacter asburiae]|uniref:DUF551 domain-containing protein n=1 Tax=Enterobacter asburiae TaxID=61645 RepID=UPI003CF02E40